MTEPLSVQWLDRHAVAVAAEQRASTPVRDVMVAPVFVPESLELDDLLDMLRKGGLQIALVVDEFGDVAGLVTLEDLVEEIVGEVRDEHDQDEAAPRRGDGERHRRFSYDYSLTIAAAVPRRGERGNQTRMAPPSRLSQRW